MDFADVVSIHLRTCEVLNTIIKVGKRAITIPMQHAQNLIKIGLYKSVIDSVEF